MPELEKSVFWECEIIAKSALYGNSAGPFSHNLSVAGFECSLSVALIRALSLPVVLIGIGNGVRGVLFWRKYTRE